MLVVGGMTSLSGAVIGSLTISFIAEFLRRVEQGVDVGPLHIPSRLGLREVGLAIIMLAILILRPRGIVNGREIPWPGRGGLRGLRSGQPGPTDLPPADAGVPPP